jgi:hypothetical protein
LRRLFCRKYFDRCGGGLSQLKGKNSELSSLAVLPGKIVFGSIPHSFSPQHKSWVEVLWLIPTPTVAAKLQIPLSDGSLPWPPFLCPGGLQNVAWLGSDHPSNDSGLQAFSQLDHKPQIISICKRGNARRSSDNHRRTTPRRETPIRQYVTIATLALRG